MLTNTKTELQLLIAGCEAYLKGNDDHLHGFCWWFNEWLVATYNAGVSDGYSIAENFDLRPWLMPECIYVDKTKGRTPRREAFVMDLRDAAIARLEEFFD